MHYQRKRIHGSVDYVKPPETATERAYRFWEKVNKRGSVPAGRPELGRCWEWTAGRNGSGYGQFSWFGRDVQAHRVAYELTVGPIPDGQLLDHTCHNIICVKPEHLRFATTKQNAENRQGGNRNSKSGIRGVSQRADGHWVGTVGHNYVKHIRYCASKEEAVAYVVAQRKEFFTHTIERKSA